MERVTGSLETGKWADFILVDGDYFTVPESAIDDLRVSATYVGGRNVTPR
jgi:predicted amidohydrolase YtcJ